MKKILNEALYRASRLIIVDGLKSRFSGPRYCYIISMILTVGCVKADGCHEFRDIAGYTLLHIAVTLFLKYLIPVTSKYIMYGSSPGYEPGYDFKFKSSGSR
jgi:hypothetical protein